MVFNLEALLGRLRLIQCSCHLIKPRVGVNNRSLEKLSLLVKFRLALNSIFQVTSGISKITFKAGLILLSLDLVAIHVVNLFSKLAH